MVQALSLVAGVRDLALLGRPLHLSKAAPETRFLSASEIEEDESAAVASAHRENARATVLEAYAWCQRNFGSDGPAEESGAITLLQIAATPPGQLMTASAQAFPGQVLVGADWPLETHYRLGSLLAHEAVHQALFTREASESPARPGSLAYSPWRVATRPGRLAWHAFWTFACQIALIVETSADPAMHRREPRLGKFASRLIPRLPIALDSLDRFGVLSDEELQRAREAMEAIEGPVEQWTQALGLERAVQSEAEIARSEYETWAISTIEAREHKGVR